MFKSERQIEITKNDVKFYIEQAQNLAYDYEMQYKKLGVLSDYITVDIASDWLWKDLKTGILKMHEENYISEKVVKLYQEIDYNFQNVSMDGKCYDEEIWTLESLQIHSFWSDQRKRAKEILAELEKIKIE